MMKKIAIFMTALVAMLALTSGVFADEAPAAQPSQQLEQPAAQPADLLKLKINFNGTSELTYTGFVEEKYHEQLKTQYEPLGYTVTAVDVNGAKALELKKIAKKNEVTTFSLPGSEPDDYKFLKIKGLLSDTYIVSSTRFDMRQYPVQQEILKLTFETPVKPKYSNAPEQKGANLSIWSIKGGEANPVDMVLVVPNLINLAILLIIVLLAIFIIFAVIASNKKKRQEQALSDMSSFDDVDIISVDSEQTEGDVEDPFEEMSIEEITADIDEEVEEIEKVEEIDTKEDK